MMQQTMSTKELLSKHITKKKEKGIYLDIWYTLNCTIVEELVEKKVIELPKLGYLKILRFKRTFRLNDKGKLNLKVDWIKTKAGWKDGSLNKDKFIYYTRNWGIMFQWTPNRIRNITGYYFRPSRSNGTKSQAGVVNKLWGYLAQEDTNYLKIPFRI